MYIKSYDQYRILENDDKLEYGDNDDDSVKVASDSLNILIDQIKEYKSKRGNLENLIMNNSGEESKDISKNISDILDDGNDGRNKFLSMYVTIVGKMRKVANLEDKIKYFDELKKERKGDLVSSSNLSDITDREEQKAKLTDQVTDIDKNVNDMKKDISDVEREIAENKKDLEKNIKEVEKKFKDDVKNSEWSVQSPK